jgi:hypothetical protein
MQRDFAKVLDFGLVKTISAEIDTRMTAEGVTTGTPGLYASRNCDVKRAG